MAYPPSSFNWNWVDLPYTASLADVISTVNWIGQNLDANYTNWIDGNNADLYSNIETAKTDASNAAAAASNASTAASNAQTTADRAEAKADVATGKISRCSYLRGTH